MTDGLTHTQILQPFPKRDRRGLFGGGAEGAGGKTFIEIDPQALGLGDGVGAGTVYQAEEIVLLVGRRKRRFGSQIRMVKFQGMNRRVITRWYYLLYLLWSSG